MRDAAGIEAEYVAVEDVQPGSRIASGWRPWPVVERVECEQGGCRVLYESGVTAWVRRGTELPVLTYDPEEATRQSSRSES